MNIKQTFAIVFFAVALPFFFYSCSKDDDEIVTTPTEEEEEEDPVVITESVYTWIESEMRENYYWYSEIPAASSLNYKLGVLDFFDSLLSSKDGKHNDSSDYFYSYIESTSDVSASTKSISQTDYSYGFEFQIYNMVDQNDNPLGYSYAHILYVVPNSPASEAGIKRGMWITKIDGKNITESNYTTLLGSTATKFTMATFETDKRFVAAGDINISSARAIEDDPVHYHTIITDQKSGKKIGYLVYNHFTDSKTDGDEKYNKELLALSKEFAGVDEFVLDLRYNGGGLITCAQLLSTILAPSSALNQTFCNMTFNDKQSPRTYNLSYSSRLISGGTNLNLSKLYVLVSNRTASASELVINALRPYMNKGANIILIGEQTEGKNVGSETFENTTYKWEMHPITCQIYNSKGESDFYVNGFTPKYQVAEIDHLDKIFDFGNTDEIMLSKAISIINGTYSATKASTRSTTTQLRRGKSSLERKATNGVEVDGIRQTAKQ